MSTLPPGPAWPSPLQVAQIIARPIPFLEACHRRYGDWFTLRLLGIQSPPIVFVSDPDALQAIFTTLAPQFDLGKVTYVFRPLTGDQSLIMQDGERHQRSRRLLMPALQGNPLCSYGPMVSQIVAEATVKWASGTIVPVRQVMLDISLDIILRVVFGLELGPRYHQLKPRLHALIEYATSPLYSVQFFWPALQQNWGPWSPWGRFLKLRQEIDDLLLAEVQEQRSAGAGDRQRVLNLLLAAQDETGQSLSDREIRDQLMTLLLLGHETTASALTWAFYWLHRYPSILTRLQQDLAAGALQLNQENYLDAVCRESLRLYPIALIAQPRQVRETACLGNYTFHPGTILVPNIYAAQRRPSVYSEPEQFNPDRFLTRKFTPYEYLPFGGGSRRCIGMSFALFEMKQVLAALLQSFSFTIARYPHVSPTEIKPVRRGITFVPSDRFQLQVC